MSTFASLDQDGSLEESETPIEIMAEDIQQDDDADKKQETAAAALGHGRYFLRREIAERTIETLVGQVFNLS